MKHTISPMARFWRILSILCLALTVLFFPWPPTRIGSIFFGILTACLFLQFLMTRAGKQHMLCRVLSIIGTALFGLFVLSMVYIQGIILTGMSTDAQAQQADVVLVLGAQVYQTGVPSATLQKRIDTARDWLIQHPDGLAVLCGGQGANEPFPEALAMYQSLVRQGISADRLLLEDTSTNTIENIAHAKLLLDARLPAGYIAAVISSDFHLARARHLLQQADITPYAIAAETPYLIQRIALHIREYGSILGLMVTGRW